MKKLLITISLIMMLVMLVSCNTSETKTPVNTDGAGVTTEKQTESATEVETEVPETGYISVEDYANAENVVSVKEYNTKSSDNFDGYDVVFKNGDEEVKVLFTVPRNYRNVSYPTVLYFPGIATSHSTSAAMFTDNDCICITFELRPSRDVSDSEMFDVGFVIDLLLESEFIDKEHIYTAGSSLGSVIALRTAKEHKEHIDGVVVADVISDFVEAHSQNPAVCEYYCGGTPDEVPEEYAERTALNFASEIECPVLLLKHVDVPMSNTTQADALKSAMDNAGGDCTILNINGMSSDFVSNDARDAFEHFVEENN